jgi:hypothetical protein
MDGNAAAPGVINHRLELYTHHLLIQGTVRAAFKRTSDLLNRSDGDFIVARDALISPVGQPPSDKPLEGPIMVGSRLLHFAVELPADGEQSAQPGDHNIDTELVGGREAFITKNHYRCFASTDVYSFNGYCHLHPNTTLENLLRGSDLFVPMTRVVISLVANPDVAWEREVVVINKERIGAMYLTDQLPAAADPTAPGL